MSAKLKFKKYLAFTLTFFLVFSLFPSIPAPVAAADSGITYEITNPGAASTSGVTVDKTVSGPIFSGSDVFFDITLAVTDTHSVETILNEATYGLARDGGGNFYYTLYKTEEELKAAAAQRGYDDPSKYTIYPVTFQFVDSTSADPTKVLYTKTVYVYDKMDGWMNGNAFVGFKYGTGSWLRSDSNKIANEYFKVDISADEYYSDLFYGSLALSVSDAVAPGFSFVSFQDGYPGTASENSGNITWTLGTQNTNIYSITYRVKMTTAQEAVYPVGSATVTYKDYSQGQNPPEMTLTSKIPTVKIIYPRYTYTVRYWFEVAEGTSGAQNINGGYYVQYLINYPDTVGVTKFLEGTAVTVSNIDSNLVKTITGYLLSNSDFSLTISKTESNNVIDLYYNKSVTLTVQFVNQNSDVIKAPVVYSNLKVGSSTDFSGVIVERLTGTDSIKYKLNWNGAKTFTVNTDTLDTIVTVTYIPLAIYTVDYAFNAPSPDGVAPPDAQSYDEDHNTLQLPTVTAPAGWLFKGWADHQNGETVNSSFTVYGNWVQLFDLDVLYVFDSPEVKAAYHDALALEYAKYDDSEDPAHVQNQVKAAGFIIDKNADSFSERLLSQAESGTPYSVPAKAVPPGFAIIETSPTAGILTSNKTITYTIGFGDTAAATAKYWVEVLPDETPGDGTTTTTNGGKTYKLVDTMTDGRIYGTYSFSLDNSNLPVGTEFKEADGALTGTIGTQNITVNIYYDYIRLNVAFDFTNEGPADVSEPADVTVIYGRTVSNPGIGKIGWVFDGWYDIETLYDFSKPVTDDLTLTGSWQRIEYRVKYSTTGNPDYTAPVDNNIYYYGDTVDVKGVGEYNTSDYIFSGWTPNTATISVIQENIGDGNTIYITGTFTPIAKYNYYVQYYYNGDAYGEPVMGLTPMNAGYEFSAENNNLDQFDTNPREAESSVKRFVLDRIDGITISSEGENTIKVYYVIKMYQLTIHYKSTSGTTLAADHSENLAAGSAYSVTSPTIAYYTPNQTVVSGTLDQDTEITVTYTYNYVPPVDPPVNPPVNPPVDPPVNPPVNPPVDPPVEPPVENPPEEEPVEPHAEPDVPEQALPEAGGFGMESVGLIGAGTAFLGLVLGGRKKKDENSIENNDK